MAYVPINIPAYVAAYSGAIAGMAVSGWITDPVSADYALVTQIAGAFAQEFDIVWNNATQLNNLETAAISEIIAQQFSNRGPGPLANSVFVQPSSWSRPAAACAALVLQSDAYFAGQGINPGTGGGGGGTLTAVAGQLTIQGGNTVTTLGGSVTGIADNTARDAIPANQRNIGMTAYITGSNKIFRLLGGIANANWVDITIGLVSNASSGLAPQFGAGNTVLQADGTNPAWNGFLQLDTNPATGGTIRLGPASTIKVRDFGNINNISVISFSNDVNNSLIIGDAAVGGGVAIVSPLAVNIQVGGVTSLSIGNAQIFIEVPQFTFAAQVTDAIISNLNNAGVATGTESVLRAQGSTGTGNGGTARLQGGRPGAGGIMGGAALQLNTDDTKANMQTMVECRAITTTRRVVSINRAADITAVQMPANTGDLVTYIGNAATNPTASAVSGGILYASGGALRWRGSAGTDTQIAAA